jgi:hypothetical protein
MSGAYAKSQTQYANLWSAHVDELYKVALTLDHKDADEMSGIISRAKQLINIAAQNVQPVREKEHS